ncbi:hypothetical protein CCACVL1_29766 [Corchorus capsularis]|uniref:Uncharacterized protein n=1 Tax=Corchorus capsularis TaxID=210143 RepID=A0A1R3G057_COCAP|nr:hypothetical protein CCACVL1_29766 [Corchorus capsularis]
MGFGVAEAEAEPRGPSHALHLQI